MKGALTLKSFYTVGILLISIVLQDLNLFYCKPSGLPDIRKWLHCTRKKTGRRKQKKIIMSSIHIRHKHLIWDLCISCLLVSFVQFKVLVLTFKAIYKLRLTYLKDHLCWYEVTGQICWAQQWLLGNPALLLRIQMLWSVAAPMLQNWLSGSIRKHTSFLQFQRACETELFRWLWFLNMIAYLFI